MLTLFEGWVCHLLGKEPRVGIVQMPERLLERYSRDIIQEYEVGILLQQRERATLRCESQRFYSLGPRF